MINLYATYARFLSRSLLAFFCAKLCRLVHRAKLSSLWTLVPLMAEPVFLHHPPQIIKTLSRKVLNHEVGGHLVYTNPISIQHNCY